MTTCAYGAGLAAALSAFSAAPTHALETKTPKVQARASTETQDTLRFMIYLLPGADRRKTPYQTPPRSATTCQCWWWYSLYCPDLSGLLLDRMNGHYKP